jgi:hemolysin activation/secretion protein
MRLRRGTFALVAAGVQIGVAHAQGPVPQGSPIPRILPSLPPSVAPGLTPPQSATPDAAPNIEVTIRRVVIDGATAFSAEQLDTMTKGLIGSTSLPKIEAVRLAILNRYRDNGFVLTAVSAGVDAQETVTFVVSEGRIADVKLDGDIGPAGTLILRFLNHLTEQRPIAIATLEHWLLLAEEVPGVSLRTVLRPSTEEPGALTLIAEVSRAPFSGLLVADNAAFPQAGPAEGLIVLDANSFSEYGEKTEVSVYHTSGNTENFGQAESDFYIGGSGLRVRIYGGYGPTNPSSPLRDIGYHGTTTVAGFGATYPLIRRRQQTLDLTASFDAIESRVDVQSGTVAISKDSLRVLRFGAAYALQDTLLGDARRATNAASARLSKGLPGLGASASLGNGAASSGEVVSFTKVNAEISRTQTLFEPWAGASVSLLGLLAGQWSNDVLPQVEQFYLGGLRLNPGYYSGEVTGDTAVAAYGELRLDDTWELSLLGRSFDTGAQPFGFWSWGETWNNSALQPNRRVTSAGGGIRLTLTRYTEFDLIGVSRFVLNPSGAGVTPLQSDAVYWRVIARF